MRKHIFIEILNDVEYSGANFFGVIIEMEDGSYELIINHKSSLISKREYYKKTYNDDMEHNFNNNIRIVELVAHDDFSVIEETYRHYCGEI